MPQTREQRLAVSVVSNLGLRILTLGLGLFSFRLLVDSLGKEQYGLFTLASTLLGYFSLLGMGIPGGVIKFVADCKGKKDLTQMARVISSAMGFYLIIGSVIALTLWAFSRFGIEIFKVGPAEIPTARRLLVMMGLWAVVAWPMQVYGQVLMGLQEFHSFNIAAGAQSILMNVGYILLAYLRVPVEGIVLILVFSQFCLFVMTQRLVRRCLPDLPLSFRYFEWATFRQLFGFSVWLMVMGLAGLLIFQSQNFLLGVAVSTAAITIYSALSMPMIAIRELNSLVLSASLPAFAEAHSANDRGFVESLILRGSRINMIFIISPIAAAIATAYPALYVWMGAEYANQASICRLLLAYYAWSAAFSVIGQAMMATGHVRLVGSMALIGAVATVGLSALLVSRWKMMALVLGLILPSAALTPVIVPLYFGRLGISIRRFFLEVALPIYGTTAVLGAGLWWGTRFLGEHPHLIATVAYCALGGLMITGVTALIALPQADRSKAIQLVKHALQTLISQTRQH